MNIKDYIQEYEAGTLQITDTISYSVKDVLQENRRLYHSKFQNPLDSGGLEKIFYNIGWIVFDTLYRNTDVDTKDINLRSTNGNAIPLVALIKMAVQSHLRKTNFGTFINKVRRNILKDGTCLVKMVDGAPEVVDLLNVVRPPHGSPIQDTGCAERVFMTYDEVMSYREEYSEHWAEIQSLWERLQKEGLSEFTIYEHWCIDEFDGKYQKGCIKYLDNTITEPEDTQSNTDWTPYIELERYKTPYKRLRKSKRMQKALGKYEPLYPYKEVHFIDVEGRWLGFSVFELVSGLLNDYNEKMNLKRKKDLLDLRGLFVHKKGKMGGSLTQEWLEELETGTTISLEQDEELDRLITSPVTMELITSVDKLFELARQITGTTAQGTGEEMPASTTATVAVVNQKAAQTSYDVVIEQISLFLVEFFEDFYLDVILDELSQEDLIDITGDPSELEELDKVFVDNLVYAEAEKYKAKTGLYPIPQEVEAERQKIMQELGKHSDMRWVELKKPLYKLVHFAIEFFVNNESFDKNTQIKNILQVLADQNFTGSRKKLYAQLLDLIGLSGKQFEKTDEEIKEELDMMQAKAMAGSAPMGGGAPMARADGMAQESAGANSVVA